jgi:hypothetical protein
LHEITLFVGGFEIWKCATEARFGLVILLDHDGIKTQAADGQRYEDRRNFVARLGQFYRNAASSKLTGF